MNLFEYTAKYPNPVDYSTVTGFNYNLVAKYHASVGLNFETSYFKTLLDRHCNFDISDAKFNDVAQKDGSNNDIANSSPVDIVNAHRSALGLTTLTTAQIQAYEIAAKQGGWVRNEVCADIVSRPRPIYSLNQQHGENSSRLDFFANCDFGVHNIDDMALDSSNGIATHKTWRDDIWAADTTSISKKDPIFGNAMNGYVYLPYIKGEGVHGSGANAFQDVNAISGGWAKNGGNYVGYGSYSTDDRRVYNHKNENTTNIFAGHNSNGVMTADLSGWWSDTTNPSQSFTNAPLTKANGGWDSGCVQSAFEFGHYQNWMYRKARNACANHNGTYNGAKQPLIAGNFVRNPVVHSTLGFNTIACPYLDMDIGMTEWITNDTGKSYWHSNQPCTWKYIMDLAYGDSTASNKWVFIMNHDNAGGHLAHIGMNLVADGTASPSDTGGGEYDTNNYVDKIGRIGYPVEDAVIVSGDSVYGLFVRRFTHGVVICNLTDSSKTFALPTSATTTFPAKGTLPTNWQSKYTVGASDDYSTGADLPNTVTVSANTSVIAKLKAAYYDGTPDIPDDPTPTPTTELLRPTNFSAVKRSGANTIDVTWTNNTTDCDSITLMWNKSGTFDTSAVHTGNESDVNQIHTSTLSGSTTAASFTPSPLTNDTYYCKIRCVRGTEFVDSWIDAVDLGSVPSGAPSTPTNLRFNLDDDPLIQSGAVEHAATGAGNWVRYKKVHWDAEAVQNSVPVCVIQTPLEWTGDVGDGFEVQMRVTNVPASHPAAKWEGIWFHAKDRYTHDNPNNDGWDRRQAGNNYSIHLNEYFNTFYAKPYEMPYRSATEVTDGHWNPFPMSEYPSAESFAAMTSDSSTTDVLVNFTGGSKVDIPPCTVSWRVRGCNSSGASAWSNIFSFDINPNNMYENFNVNVHAAGEPPIGPNDAPMSPTNFVVNAPVKNSSGVYSTTMTWSIPTKGNHVAPQSMRIFRKLDGERYWTEMATLAATATSYTDSLGTNPKSTGYTYNVHSCAYSNTSSIATKLNCYAPSVSTRVDLVAEVVTPPQQTTPVAPSNMAVVSWTKSTNYWLNVSWSDNSNNETGFRIYRSLDSGVTWDLLKSPAANAHSYNIDCGANPSFGTWQLKVAAYNAVGETDSPVISYACTAIADPPPATPTNLAVGTLRREHTALKIPLTWTDASNNETGYKVYHAVGSATNWTLDATLAAGTTSYTIDAGTSAPVGTYFFKVAAYNTSAESESTIISQYISPTGVNESIAPLAATGVTVSFSRGDSTLQYFASVTWTNHANDADGNYIQVSTDNSTWTTKGTVSADNTVFNDINLGLTPTGTRYFRVAAYNEAGQTNSTAVSKAMPPTPYIPKTEATPTIPTNVVATVAREDSTKDALFTITFDDMSVNETGFSVYMSKNGGAFNKQTTSTILASPFILRLPATEYGSYKFKMTAYNSNGESQQSSESTTVLLEQWISPPPPIVLVPVAPTELVVDRLYRNLQKEVVVKLKWLRNSDNETGFSIYRNNVLYQQVPAGNSEVSINFGELIADYTYTWKVCAFNSAGNSAFTNTATSIINSAIDQEKPPTPQPTDPYPVYMSSACGRIVTIIKIDYIEPKALIQSSGSVVLNTANLIAFSAISRSNGGMKFNVEMSGSIIGRSTVELITDMHWKHTIAFNALINSSGCFALVVLIAMEALIQSLGRVKLYTTNTILPQAIIRSSGSFIIYNEFDQANIVISMDNGVEGEIELEG